MSTPFVDATLHDGSRPHVDIPDVTRCHMVVCIRKFVPQTWESGRDWGRSIDTGRGTPHRMGIAAGTR